MKEMRIAKLISTRYFSPDTVAKYGLGPLLGKIVVVEKYGEMYHIPGILGSMGVDGEDYKLLHH